MRDVRDPDPIAEEILSPLTALQTRYLSARELLDRLLEGLEPLTRGPEDRTPRAMPGGARRPVTRGSATATPIRAELDVESDDLEALLDFQERLSTLSGVESIAVAGTTPTGARIIVELTGTFPGTLDMDDEELPTLVCAWCGKLMRAGGDQVSHGLCEDCAESVLGRHPTT